MNNKKGFTLVEIIVVVGLLAIIGVTIGISLNRNIKKNEENKIKEFNKKIVGAANLFASNNESIITNLYEEKGYTIIRVNDLIDAGLISDNLVDPETNEKVTGEEIIKIDLDSSGTINIEYPVKTSEGDYLQTKTLEVELYTDKSTICMNGLNTRNLGYIKKDDNKKEGILQEGYLNPTGENGKEINIKCNIDNVKTDVLGTYDIKYDYQTEDGIWKQATRQVLVVDKVKPTCPIEKPTIPEWIKAPRKVEVACNDNYKCDKNIVTETFSNTRLAKVTISDLSGNTEECDVYVYSDVTSPSDLTLTKNPTDEWAQSVKLTGTAIDELSGILYYKFTEEGNLTDIKTSGNKLPEAASEKITEEYVVDKERATPYIYYFYAQDKVGNVAKSASVEVKIDRTAPVINEAETTEKASEVQIRATDNLSGVNSYCVNDTNSVDGCIWETIANNPKDTEKIIANNKHLGKIVYIFVKDAAGNISTSKSLDTSCVEVEYHDGDECSAKCDGGTLNQLAYDKFTKERCKNTTKDLNSGGSECNTMGCCSKTTTSCSDTWSWSECSVNSDRCGNVTGTRYEYQSCVKKSDYNGQVCSNFINTRNENSLCSTNIDCCSWTTEVCGGIRWGSCSASCGGGTRDAYKTCTIRSAYPNSNAACGSSYEQWVDFEWCNQQSCYVPPSYDPDPWPDPDPDPDPWSYPDPTTKSNQTKSGNSCNLPYDADRGIDPCALCSMAGMSECKPAAGSGMCPSGTIDNSGICWYGNDNGATASSCIVGYSC